MTMASFCWNASVDIRSAMTSSTDGRAFMTPEAPVRQPQRVAHLVRDDQANEIANLDGGQRRDSFRALDPPRIACCSSTTRGRYTSTVGTPDRWSRRNSPHTSPSVIFDTVSNWTRTTTARSDGTSPGGWQSRQLAPMPAGASNRSDGLFHPLKTRVVEAAASAKPQLDRGRLGGGRELHSRTEEHQDQHDRGDPANTRRCHVLLQSKRGAETGVIRSVAAGVYGVLPGEAPQNASASAISSAPPQPLKARGEQVRCWEQGWLTATRSSRSSAAAAWASSTARAIRG